MADFNQFGSVKPGNLGGPSNPQHCAQCEAMLSDALDGALSAADKATFDLHLAGCPTCAAMFADAQRGAAWMEMLKYPRPEPPATLLERIIAQTSGAQAASKDAALAQPPIVLGPTDRLRTPNAILGQPTLVPAPSIAGQPVFVPANVIPFRSRLTQGFRSLGQTMLQPRLAMTAAMAFFSIALTLNLTGVRITDLRPSDLKPSSIARSVSLAKARVVRYSDNLRVVYELQTRVRDLQQRSSDDNGPSNIQAPQNNPTGQKPGSQKQDQKQTKPSPGSSRRETPAGGIQLAQLAESVPPQAPPLFSQAFVVLNPSVFKQEGGLV